MKVKIQTITTYEAFDGAVFLTTHECESYEWSKLPLYERIAIEQQFVWHEENRNELHVCGELVKSENMLMLLSLGLMVKMYKQEIIRMTTGYLSLVLYLMTHTNTGLNQKNKLIIT